MSRRHFVSAAILTLTAIASPVPASAGFLEALFGGGSFQPAPSHPVEMTVGPSRSFARPRVRRRSAVHRRPGRTRVASHREMQKAVPIDPKRDPNWFLHDPTLRRGDIVVLERGVFVFTERPGSPPYAPEDFVSLDKSNLVSPATRALVGRMAAVPTGEPSPSASRTDKLAIVSGRDR